MSEAKSKGWKSVLDLFSNEVPDRPRNTPLPTAPRNTPLPPAPGGSHAGPPPAGKVDQKALASLEARLQESIPPEYASFMETYQSLTEDIPDERTRFKVALKTSKTSADHILAALDQLLNVMKDAKEKFARGHEARAQEKLGASQQLIQSINEQLASKREQIAALNVEMDALNEQVITATREQSEERDHLIQVQSGFEAAHAQVIGRLNDQKNRVSSLTTKV